jgi:pimeloyl-ACP methyl ester carboxylesterase
MEPNAMTSDPNPYVRRAGSGPVVVCLHANSSSSAQWRALTDRLADRYTVLAPDGWSAGRSPMRDVDDPASLDDELALLEPVFAAAGDAFHLIGHSYGGAVALKAALRHRGRVRSVVVYEPTLFWMVVAAGRPDDVAGIRDTATDAAAAVARGDAEGAARGFVDFWNGDGSWDRIPQDRKPALMQSLRYVSHWRHATFNERMPRDALAQIDVPVLLLGGTRSPLSGRAPLALAHTQLSGASRADFDGLGHMGPVPHAETVNPVIDAFLSALGSSAGPR